MLDKELDTLLDIMLDTLLDITPDIVLDSAVDTVPDTMLDILISRIYPKKLGQAADEIFRVAACPSELVAS